MNLAVRYFRVCSIGSGQETNKRQREACLAAWILHCRFGERDNRRIEAVPTRSERQGDLVKHTGNSLSNVAH